MRAAVLLAMLVLACKHDDERAAKPPAAPVATAPLGADGLRHVAIEASKDGYTPSRITGKPNEQLVLEVTRTTDADCLSQLVAPDKHTYDLPLGKPVAIPVTVPASGEVTFACGMGMFQGTIVAR